LVNALLERETLDKAEIAQIFSPVVKRPPREAWTGSVNRIPSNRPAIDMPKPKDVGTPTDEANNV
jgi:cell division protease FtsH